MSVAAPRLRVRVRGTVQGVGFRPYVYGLARAQELGGFVRNDGEGVEIEVEGAGAEAFVRSLGAAPPPLARIDGVACEPCEGRGETEFCIAESLGGATRTRIGADSAICAECLADLFDPLSRFFEYPLVNCTHCGPRYTLTRALPYDRAQTSMAPFPMCEACARDYKDPSNRRFHAEPIACRNCGPQLDHDVSEIADCLKRGGVAAVKGLGGFHLMCDARDEAAVARLRARKARERKPFAVMVLNPASAARFAHGDAAEMTLFADRTAPVVLMRGRGGLAPGVAPGLAEVGLMRAYTPLHWLIFHALLGRPEGTAWREAASGIALVATSANVAGEPLIADDTEARDRLVGIADLVVGHAREIVARADDSVARIVAGAPAFLRRARGFAPDPLDLGRDGPSGIAFGGDLKNTICLTRGREAFVSPHIGDLDDRRTIAARDATIRRMQDLLDVRPEWVACDLHPDFVSTRAAEATGLPLVRVQHHFAHVAASAAEAGWTGPVLGVALDGFGYGADGAAWGGELIALDGAAWRRVGHLKPLPLPGGDKAAREPWRMGVAALQMLGRGAEAGALFADVAEAGPLAAALARGARVGLTTSLGRIFDAAAALAGVCWRQAYEGEAAMRLEALVGRAPPPAAPSPRSSRGEGWGEGSLDLTPLLAALIGLPPPEAAQAFHAGLIAALSGWIADAAQRLNLDHVALGGGCLMNRVLSEGLLAALAARGLQTAVPRALPANDGGLSFGQAVVALQTLT